MGVTYGPTPVGDSHQRAPGRSDGCQEPSGQDLGDPTVARLLKAAQDSDPQIQDASREVLKNSWGEPTAARLVEALKDPNPDVQNTAYDLLCAIWHEPTIDRLQLAAHDHDPQIQAAARFVLGDSWDETYAIPSLLEMYFSNNEEEKTRRNRHSPKDRLGSAYSGQTPKGRGRP